MRRVRGLVASLVFVLVLVAGSGTLLATGTQPQLGLDLVGGVAVTLSAPEGTDRDVLDRALENIRSRVDALGVAEPSLQVVGDRNIEVQIPGLDQGSIRRSGTQFCVTGVTGQDLGCFNTRAEAEAKLQETGRSRLLELIGKTARLEFRELLQVVPPEDPAYADTPVTCPGGETDAPTPTPTPTPSGSASPSPSPSPTETASPDATASPSASPSPGEDEPGIEGCSNEDLQDEEIVILGEPGAPDEETKYRLGPAELVGGIKRAVAQFDPGTQGGGTPLGWFISFELDAEASDVFAEVTTRLANRQLAIVLDRRLQSAPNVTEPITNGSGQITGGFSEQEAKDLAVVLNTGALPVELTRESVETVSATLGRESLHQGLVAGIVGLVALALYLAFYYRLLGVVTWLGMSVWSVLALTIVALLGEHAGYSLTLAGVAGLVVSLGITADSYIVFYERLKDEVRKGKTLRVAVHPAFKRAWHTIIAADVVTILAAAVLYLLAVSSVRGFALTLGLATALDMFVVYSFKRPLVFLIANNDRIANLRGFGLRSGVAADPLPGEFVPGIAGGSR